MLQRWFLLFMALTGCASSPDPRTILGADTPLIDDVTIEGVTRFSKGKLLAHTHIGETSWTPFSPDYHFNAALIAVDARRIEALYRAHGYHDARVVRIEARPDDDEDEDEVDVYIEIHEGPVTLARTVDLTWQDDTALETAARTALTDQMALKVDEPFEIPRLNDTVGTLRLQLMALGHPLARANGRTIINEGALRADTQLTVTVGPTARVGRIHFKGLVDVPAYLVANEVEFAQGEMFSPGLVKDIEGAVKAMDVFEWVTVEPPFAVVNGQVDLMVRVSEADPQSIRLGSQVSFHAARWEQRLIAGYTNTNLFGHLTRLDLTLIGGYAELPDPFDPAEHGPVVAVVPVFTKKGLVEKQLLWTFAPRLDVNIQPGYQFISPSERFGVARWFTRHLRLDLSHNLRYVDFFNVDPALDTNTSVLGRDFRDPYLLSFGELGVDIFFLDSVLSPQNGTALQITYALAGGPFGGDFDFHKTEATWRSYWRPFKNTQIALRLNSGIIQPYGPQAGAPLDRKFYLGGADTVRGWGTRRLSPRLDECTADPETGDESCKSIPIGGLTVVQGNFEIRQTLGKLSIVAFADVGDVQADELTWVPDEWNYSAGPGLRYDSPVGLFRLDVGFRLNDPGVFTDEPTWAAYFGFGETF
jgi:outer membrane protein assembly factor BamA